MTAKRTRSAAFSAHDKLVHKSCVLLRREAKKVRAFMVRKLVQQLKQVRQQLDTRLPDAAQQQTHELKLRASVHKFEREHAVLKALDLDKLVEKAKLQTGLDTPLEVLHGREAVDREWDEEQSDSGGEERSSEVDAEDTNDKEETELIGDELRGAEQCQAGKERGDAALEEKLMDRVLAHKQIVVVLDAIRRLVKEEEKEAERKRRAQEKRALKRGRHESLVGNTGRSGVVPTSLFLGSLSGRGEVDDGKLEMDADGYGAIGGADDDIAEFLGEKKKRKNRPGQVARRTKAIRKEEALKRKEERAQGIFVPYKDTTVSASSYGLSERPKKAKMKAKPGKRDKPQSLGRKTRTSGKEVAPQKEHAIAPASAPMNAAHPSWLAKQKQKEKEKVSLTAFSGKKITFD